MRNVVSLGFVSMFTDMSTEMVLGVLPVFLVGELGVTRSVLGLIEGSAEATSNIFRVFSGMFSDRFRRRKPLVFAGYLLSTLVKPFFYVAVSGVQAFAIRLGDRVGKGVRTAPRDALISESVTGDRLGKSFGVHRTLDQTGAVVGPSLAFLLIPLIGLRGVFWFSFVPGIISVLILLFFVREVRPLARPQRVGIMSGLHSILKKEFVALLAVICVFSVGAYNFSFVLLKSGELGVAAAFIPLIYGVINITHTLMGMPAGVLSDRFGEERILMFGYGLFAAATVLSLLSLTGWFYALSIALVYGLYQGVGETVQRAMIPKYAPPELRATAYGVYYLAVGVCLLVANVVFGSLWDTMGSQAAFSYSLVTTLVALVGFAAFALKRLPRGALAWGSRAVH